MDAMNPRPDPSEPRPPGRERAPASDAAGREGSGSSPAPNRHPARETNAGPGPGNPASEPRKASDFLPLVYDELRRLAARRLAGESREHTLQPTALVHEAWVRIAGSGDRTWHDRQHFFATAAEAMRRILVDRARRRQAAKRGSNPERLDLDDLPLAAPDDDDRLLAMNEALERFASVDARKAELVHLRYFAGLSFEEAAEVLSIAVPTAKQWMAYARAWLRVELTRSRDASAPTSPPSR